MRLASGKNYTRRVRKLQPKLIFVCTKNMYKKYKNKNLINKQIAERETISENNLLM